MSSHDDGLDKVGRSIRDLGEEVGFLVINHSNGGVILRRGDMTIRIPGRARFVASRASYLFEKVLRYGDPHAVAAYKSKHQTDAKTAHLTQRLEVPEQVRQAVAMPPQDTGPTEAELDELEDDFYVDDEPVEDVVAAFERGGPDHPVTTPPDPPADTPEEEETTVAEPARSGYEGVLLEKDGYPALNGGTLVDFFRARSGRLVTVHELAEHFGKTIVQAQKAVSRQIARNMTFREALIVHHAGALWEWRKDETDVAPGEPVRATGAVIDDRMEARRLRVRIGELETELREERGANEHWRVALQEQTNQTEAVRDELNLLIREHQTLRDNVAAAHELLKGLTA